MLLAGYPVSDVYVAEHAALAPFRDGPTAGALAWLIEAHKPEIILEALKRIVSRYED